MPDLNNLYNMGLGNLGYLNSLSSSWNGLNNIGDIRGRFGFVDPSVQFDPLKKALGAQRMLSINQAVRSAGHSATPGMSAYGIDSQYAGALQNLLGQQGAAKINQGNTMASFLANAMNSQDQFGLQKAGLYGNQLNSLANMGFNLEQLNQMPNFWDYLGSGLLGAGSSFLGGPGGAFLGQSLFGPKTSGKP